eukprot:940922-Rhodomonas_salina.1
MGTPYAAALFVPGTAEAGTDDAEDNQVASYSQRVWTGDRSRTRIRGRNFHSSCEQRCYAMSGTHLVHGGTISLYVCYAMSGPDIAYGGISLQVCYAMSGTSRYVCYAMSGTGISYGAMCLRTCYELSGTDLAYAAISLVAWTCFSGQSSPTCLCDVRHLATSTSSALSYGMLQPQRYYGRRCVVRSCALCGTKLGHGATRAVGDV